ncbi:hypothetical protein [Chryseobacterium koreense]
MVAIQKTQTEFHVRDMPNTQLKPDKNPNLFPGLLLSLFAAYLITTHRQNSKTVKKPLHPFIEGMFFCDLKNHLLLSCPKHTPTQDHRRTVPEYTAVEPRRNYGSTSGFPLF